LHDVLKFLFVYIVFLLGFGVGNWFINNSNTHICKALYEDVKMTKHTAASAGKTSASGGTPARLVFCKQDLFTSLNDLISHHPWYHGNCRLESQACHSYPSTLWSASHVHIHGLLTTWDWLPDTFTDGETKVHRIWMMVFKSRSKVLHWGNFVWLSTSSYCHSLLQMSLWEPLICSVIRNGESPLKITPFTTEGTAQSNFIFNLYIERMFPHSHNSFFSFFLQWVLAFEIRQLFPGTFCGSKFVYLFSLSPAHLFIHSFPQALICSFIHPARTTTGMCWKEEKSEPGSCSCRAHNRALEEDSFGGGDLGYKKLGSQRLVGEPGKHTQVVTGNSSRLCVR
jgi:hypothetical protein